MTSDELLEEGARLLAMLGINYPTYDDKAWARLFLEKARNKALDEAAAMYRGKNGYAIYEEIVAAILALKSPAQEPKPMQTGTLGHVDSGKTALTGIALRLAQDGITKP